MFRFSDFYKSSMERSAPLPKRTIFLTPRKWPLGSQPVVLQDAMTASSVAILGAIATGAAVQIATFPSLYKTACQIVPTAAKIVGVASGLAGAYTFFGCSLRESKSLKIEGNITSIFETDFSSSRFVTYRSTRQSLPRRESCHLLMARVNKFLLPVPEKLMRKN